MKNIEASNNFHTVITSDPYNPGLVLEVYIGNNWMVAVIYRYWWESTEEWTVSFNSPSFNSPLQGKGFFACEVSWKTYCRIMESLEKFREEEIDPSYTANVLERLDDEARQQYSIMRRAESFQEIHFVQGKDPTHNFRPIQEAWIGKWLVAVLYLDGWGTEEEWQVSFFSPSEEISSCSISWENAQKIQQTFDAFREQIRRQIPDPDEYELNREIPIDHPTTLLMDYMRGRLFQGRQEYEEAIAMFNQAIQKVPDTYNFYFSKASALRSLGKEMRRKERISNNQASEKPESYQEKPKQTQQEQAAYFTIFHNGKIENLIKKGDDIEFQLSIPYLAKIIDPSYTNFRVIFQQYQVFELKLLNDEETVYEDCELIFIELEGNGILHADVIEDAVHVYCADGSPTSSGVLKFRCGSILVFDQAGREKSLEELIEIAFKHLPGKDK